MKNFYLVLVAVLTFNTVLHAQFTDDMEYPDGPPYGEWWVPAPIIANGVGSIPGDGTTEALLDLGNKIFSVWGLEFWMYVPSNKEAYWNLQGEVPIGTGEWIVGNFFFNQDLVNPGVGLIDDTYFGDVTFNFPHDEWFRVVMNIDMNLGISVATWQLNIAGEDVLPEGTPFTNEDFETPTSLGGIDFYSISFENEFYLDDFLYINDFIEIEPNPNPLTDDMESYTEGEGIFEGWWGSWGCGEDLGCALESSSAQAYSGNLSGLVPGDATTSPDLDLGNKTSGKWALEFQMYIPQNKEGYFNLQGQIPIGAGEWIVGNIIFNYNLASPGIGFIDDSALGNVEFQFPHEEWFSVIINVDLTGGVSQGTWQFIVDGEIVIIEGTPFTNNAGQVPTSLGGISFFSLSTNTEYYLDDFNYIEGVILGTNVVSLVEFKIYPNPAFNNIHISTTEVVKKVNIYSLQGTLVKETKIYDTIDVSHLSSGLYFIEIFSEKGKSVKKLIKF